MTGAGTPSRKYYLGDDYEIAGGVATKYIRLGSQLSPSSWKRQELAAHGRDGPSRSYRTPAGIRFAAGGSPVRREVYVSGAQAESRSFTGGRRDTTGLMYLHARYYEPALGRFLSPIPLRRAVPHRIESVRVREQRSDQHDGSDGHSRSRPWDCRRQRSAVHRSYTKLAGGSFRRHFEGFSLPKPEPIVPDAFLTELSPTPAPSLDIAPRSGNGRGSGTKSRPGCSSTTSGAIPSEDSTYVGVRKRLVDPGCCTSASPP